MIEARTSLAITSLITVMTGLSIGILIATHRSSIRSFATTDGETINANALHLFFAILGQCLGIVVSNSIFLNSLRKKTIFANPNSNLDADQFCTYAFFCDRSNQPIRLKDTRNSHFKSHWCFYGMFRWRDVSFLEFFCFSVSVPGSWRGGILVTEKSSSRDEGLACGNWSASSRFS